MGDRIRVYALARILDAEPADVLDVCRRAGITARNRLSSLDAGERELIERVFRREGPDGQAGSLVPVRPRPSSGHGRACP